MAPFDNSAPPQQGQPMPSMQRAQMPQGHVQVASPVMPPGHHQAMNPPLYGHQHRNAGVMSSQGSYMQNPSPARQGNFNGIPTGGPYSNHPPLHSPHQSQGGPPIHPSMQRSGHQIHRGSMGRSSGAMSQAMPPTQNHDQMRPTAGMQHQQYTRQQHPNRSSNISGASWQSQEDNEARRRMIQTM